MEREIYDNNQIVDNISLQYYNYYHPGISMSFRTNENLNNEVVKKKSDRRFGLYNEQLMLETGFYPNKKIKLRQLQLRLWRNARVIYDVDIN